MSAIRYLLLAGSLFINACHGIRVDSDFVRDPGLEAQIIAQADAYGDINLLAIDGSIRDYLAQHIRSGASSTEKVARLQELLFGEEYLNVQYADTANLSAVEVFHTRQANCLSLVNLFVAMARHIGVDAHYHSVQVKPRWDIRGELMVLSEHINATGQVSYNTRYVIDFMPELNVQQRTAATIDDIQARALYFNNLGVDRLVAHQYEEAVDYFRNALFLDPELAIAWNNIGAAYNRLDQPTLAEYSYQRSFHIDGTSTTAINNLAKFYFTQEQFDKAEKYNRAIRRFNQRNPYYHYLLGNLAYGEKRFDEAANHYQAAIRRNKGEPDFFLAMGQAQLQLGLEKEGMQMLERGMQIIRESDQLTLPSRNKLRIQRDDAAAPASADSAQAFRPGLAEN